MDTEMHTPVNLINSNMEWVKKLRSCQELPDRRKGISVNKGLNETRNCVNPTSSPFWILLLELMMILCPLSKVTTSATQFGAQEWLIYLHEKE